MEPGYCSSCNVKASAHDDTRHRHVSLNMNIFFTLMLFFKSRRVCLLLKMMATHTHTLFLWQIRCAIILNMWLILVLHLCFLINIKTIYDVFKALNSIFPVPFYVNRIFSYTIFVIVPTKMQNYCNKDSNKDCIQTCIPPSVFYLSCIFGTTGRHYWAAVCKPSVVSALKALFHQVILSSQLKKMFSNNATKNNYINVFFEPRIEGKSSLWDKNSDSTWHVQWWLWLWLWACYCLKKCNHWANGCLKR